MAMSYYAQTQFFCGFLNWLVVTDFWVTELVCMYVLLQYFAIFAIDLSAVKYICFVTSRY